MGGSAHDQGAPLDDAVTGCSVATGIGLMARVAVAPDGAGAAVGVAGGAPGFPVTAVLGTLVVDPAGPLVGGPGAIVAGPAGAPAGEPVTPVVGAVSPAPPAGGSALHPPAASAEAKAKAATTPTSTRRDTPAPPVGLCLFGLHLFGLCLFGSVRWISWGSVTCGLADGRRQGHENAEGPTPGTAASCLVHPIRRLPGTG